MNTIRVIKNYSKYQRYVMNYQKFQDELYKKIDDTIVISSDKVNSSFSTAIDKLIDSMMIVEERSKQAKLNNIDINVSINLGPINIGISKKLSNNE